MSPQLVVRNMLALQHTPELLLILIVKGPVLLGPSISAAIAGVFFTIWVLTVSSGISKRLWSSSSPSPSS